MLRDMITREHQKSCASNLLVSRTVQESKEINNLNEYMNNQINGLQYERLVNL